MSEPEAADHTVDDQEVAIVLVALDTSTLTSEVVAFAARLARRAWSNAQLHLLHVFRSASFDRPTTAGIRHADLLAEARNYLDYHVRMARRQCPAPVTAHFAEGDPAARIVQCARAIGADFLVIGTHDTVGIERLLLGSVAAKVARRAPCSVVTVRRKQRPFTKVR